MLCISEWVNPFTQNLKFTSWSDDTSNEMEKLNSENQNHAPLTTKFLKVNGLPLHLISDIAAIIQSSALSQFDTTSHKKRKKNP